MMRRNELKVSSSEFSEIYDQHCKSMPRFNRKVLKLKHNGSLDVAFEYAEAAQVFKYLIIDKILTETKVGIFELLENFTGINLDIGRYNFWNACYGPYKNIVYDKDDVKMLLEKLTPYKDRASGNWIVSLPYKKMEV